MPGTTLATAKKKPPPSTTPKLANGAEKPPPSTPPKLANAAKPPPGAPAARTVGEWRIASEPGSGKSGEGEFVGSSPMPLQDAALADGALVVVANPT